MCDPVSISLAAVAVGSTAYSAYTSYTANSDAADSARAIAAENKRLGDVAADDAIQRGEIAAGKVDQQAEQVIGQGRANVGASGVDVSSGSAVRSFGDSAMLAALDKETIRNNAAREAFGLRSQGINALKQGEAQANAYSAAATSSILTGIGSAAQIGMNTASAAGAFRPSPTPPASTVPYYLRRP